MRSGEFSGLILIFFNGYQNICRTLAKHLIDSRKINPAVIYILKTSHYAIALSSHLGLLGDNNCLLPSVTETLINTYI